MKTLLAILTLALTGCYYNTPYYNPYEYKGPYYNYCYTPGSVRAMNHFYQMNLEGFGVTGGRRWSY